MIPSPHTISPSAAEDIKALASELGFDLCGFTPLRPLEKHEKYLSAWVDSGQAAGMEYMKRDPSFRANPRSLFPGAKTAIVLGVSYFQGALPPSPGPGYGRVARYAWGEDYHEAIGDRLKQFGERLRGLASPVEVDGWAVDAKPVMERALAEESGLGFFGKNTLIIAPRFVPGGSFHVGSFLFLAEVMVENEMDATLETVKVPDGCGGCTSCLDVCPTGAFTGPKSLDAGLCISYLTIENKGPIPSDLRPKLGDWVFGCDACQDVCPFNARSQQTKWPEFLSEKGVGPWLDLGDVISLRTTAEFKDRFKKSPLIRSKRKGLIRNALVVAGNQKPARLQNAVGQALQDEEPLVRAHALWAVEQMAGPEEAKKAAKAEKNPQKDEGLAAEVNRILRTEK